MSTTTTTKPVSNDLKPKLKPYRIRDENLQYIGVDRKVNDNSEVSYNIILHYYILYIIMFCCVVFIN